MKTTNLTRLLLCALLVSASAMSVYGAQITTVTAITGGPNPGTAGANVTLTATVFPQQTNPVPPIPTGTVTFTDNNGNHYTTTVMPSGNEGAGVLILQPAAGTYTYTAIYNGDSNYSQSPISMPFTEVVDPGTITNITISNNPGVFGQPLTITATVTGRNPTGRVTFYDNVTVLGVAQLNSSGVASITIASLPSGLRDLVAYYGGDSNNISSTSSVLTEGILAQPGLGFGPAQTYPLGGGNTMPAAVLAADVNGDGILDLVVLNGSGSISVFLGMTGGQFPSTPSGVYATGPSPVAAVIGDFNADGMLDVAVASGDGVDILLGNGNGTFQASTPISNFSGTADGIATTDFNLDGIPDLVVSNTGGSTVSVLLSAGNGSFQAAIPCSLGAGVTSPTAIGIGDFNNDGTPDIVVADGSGVTVILGSLNIIAGNIFSCQAASTPYPVGAGSQSLVVKDFTGNGDQDIAVTNTNAGTVSVLRGIGNGSFTVEGSYATDPHPYAIVTADFNGDGKPDLAVSDNSSTNGMNLFILLGNGDGTFGTPLGYASDPSLTGVVAGPFTQNGQPDVAVVSSSTNQLDVLINGFATLSIIQGNNQSAPISTTFPIGLAVNAAGFGTVAAHAPVTFTASNGYFNGVGSTAVVLTDGNGNAIAPPYTANAVPGPNVVTATAGGNTVTFTLTNALQPCTFTISPNSLVFSASGGQATLTVTPSSPSCVWSASSPIAGIQLGNSTETGSGSVHVLVQPNTTGTVVSETFNVAGQAIPVQIDATSQIFQDVTSNDYYFDYANEMYLKGITSGCSTNPPLYCPTETVTRAQMAVFLVSSVYGGSTFPYNPTPYFTDVPANAFGFAWIQALYELGITSGCGPTTFCPDEDVTRAQMAVFIIRMRYGSTANFDYPATPYFTDVPTGAFGFAWIQRMRLDQITAGCSATLYCPNNDVLRQDMAVFIMHGAFNFGLPSNEPVIVSVSPSAIDSGVPTTVTVTGANTNFVQGMTSLNPIPGVTIGTLTVTSPTTFTVQLTAAAPEAPQSIWVTTTTVSGNEEAVLPNSLTIPQ
jgi:hypothetical protein